MLLSRVQLFAIPGTVTPQVLLSIKFNTLSQLGFFIPGRLLLIFQILHTSLFKPRFTLESREVIFRICLK